MKEDVKEIHNAAMAIHKKQMKKIFVCLVVMLFILILAIISMEIKYYFVDGPECVKQCLADGKYENCNDQCY